MYFLGKYIYFIKANNYNYNDDKDDDYFYSNY